MDITELVVAAVAVYGAGLSTIIAIQKWLGNKPKIIVDYYFSDLRSDDLYITLVVENHGIKTITLSSATLEEVEPENDAVSLDSSNHVYGMEVKSGKNFKIFFPFNQVPRRWLNNEVRLIGIVKDQLGNEYRSKVIEP
jgi:hypothetical protein